MPPNIIVTYATVCGRRNLSCRDHEIHLIIHKVLRRLTGQAECDLHHAPGYTAIYGMFLPPAISMAALAPPSMSHGVPRRNGTPLYEECRESFPSRGAGALPVSGR